MLRTVVVCLLVTIFWENASARPHEAEHNSPMRFLPEMMFEPSIESAVSPAVLNQYPYYPSVRDGNANSGGPHTSVRDGSANSGGPHTSVRDGNANSGGPHTSVRDGNANSGGPHTSVRGGNANSGGPHTSSSNYYPAAAAQDAPYGEDSPERRDGWSPSYVSGKGANQEAAQGKEPRKDLLIGFIFETIEVSDNVLGETDKASHNVPDTDLWQVYNNFPFYMLLDKTYASSVYYNDDDDDDDNDFDEDDGDDDDDYDGNVYVVDLPPREVNNEEYDYMEYEDYDDENCEDCDDEDDNKLREPNDEFIFVNFFK